MPHGSVQVGEVEVIALCDGVVRSSGASTASYPDATTSTWDAARARYPDVFDDDDRWRFHIHCFVLRSAGRTVLVDTGIGPESAPAFAWSATRGRLPEELAEAGLSPGDFDDVVITHVHDDHLGWNVVEASSTPLFENARYVVHAADWSMMAAATDEEDREIFAAVLAPLERAGILERSHDRLALTAELMLVHAPGHTPGHQVVVVDSGVVRGLVAGDLVNHPTQLLQPGSNGTSDGDPALASATRAAWLEQIGRQDRLVCTAHLPEPFGHFEPHGDGHHWEPLRAGVS